MSFSAATALPKVLVTGAAGFVGAAVTRLLLAQGHEVAVLLRPTSDTRRLATCLNQLHVVHGDLADLTPSIPALRAFAPNAVAHLAWAGVKGADRNSAVQLTNIAASVALLTFAQDMQCASFVGLGSQAEYGPSTGKLTERASTHPTTLYGAAKLATGLVLERSAAVSGLPLAWLRLFSSYGNGDDPSWLLQYLARVLLAGQRPAVTAAEQLWDYIHVDDVASAVVAALQSRAAGFYNLGSGHAPPLRLTIELLRDLIDPSLPIGFGEVAYRPDQVMHLEADISALGAATGWKPRVSLETGLHDLVAWHRARSI
jgi:UDP-glucose 4-epimerase